MGIRPLFYTIYNGSFYFASEIKALFSADIAIPRQLNTGVLNEIFTFWSPVSCKTIFTGVHQLLPAHCMEVNRSGCQKQKCYWKLQFCPDEIGVATEQDYAEELRELLIDSVRLRLRADVAVGAYLSGGLDSSVIASLVRKYTDTVLQTFSVGFEDKIYDESAEQNEMVEYLGTAHQSMCCTYKDIATVFPDVIYHTETPVLRTAPTPLFLLSGLVREKNYKVVLTGEGADEILGGYDIFKEAKIRAFINADQKSEIRPLLLKRLYPYLALSPTKSAEFAKIFFATDTDVNDLFYSHRPRWKTTSAILQFLSDDIREDSGKTLQHLDFMKSDLCNLDYFNRAQYLESKVLMANYLLSSQGDRMAMAHSVEGRFPFLDHRVVEFAGRIPTRYKMKGLKEKNILKQAMRDIVPDSIINRTKQPYMAPDVQSFFSGKEPGY